MARSSSRDAVITTTAIGVLASVLAAVAHEGLGHGGMCLALGGRPIRLTSLFLQCTLQRPLIAVAGPLANVALGGIALGFARHLRDRSGYRHAQLFWWLLALYDLFFGFGYLIFSGITGTGDWRFAFGAGAISGAERAMLIVGGVVALGGAGRLLVASRPVSDPEVGMGSPSDWYLVYGAAAVVSLAAAAFDPAGWAAVLHLPPAAPLAGLGLLWTRRLIRRREGEVGRPIGAVSGSRGWVIAGALAAIVFVAVLGRGITWGS